MVKPLFKNNEDNGIHSMDIPTTDNGIYSMDIPTTDNGRIHTMDVPVTNSKYHTQALDINLAPAAPLHPGSSAPAASLLPESSASTASLTMASVPLHTIPEESSQPSAQTHLSPVCEGESLNEAHQMINLETSGLRRSARLR